MAISLTTTRSAISKGCALFSIGLAAAAGAEPLLNFPFNEGEGMQTTDTVQGAVAYFGDFFDPSTGPAWTNDTPSGLPGDYALAFNMDDLGWRQRLLADLSTNPLNLGANDTNYTLQTWVKLPTTLNTDRMVVFRTTGPGPRVSLSITQNRTLHTTVFGTQDFSSSVVIPNDNRWHHIAAVMENNFGRVRFYLDGVSRQTVNRTGQGAASDSGSPGLDIGYESNNRYYTGLLDRVRIDNTALTAEELDSDPIPGAADFASLDAHPVDVVAEPGSSVSFEATPTGNVESVFWRFRENLADQSFQVLADDGGATPKLTLNNVTAANGGFYSLVVSNAAGLRESYSARLDVVTAPGTLQKMWEIVPGQRDYVTGYSSDAGTRDLERGMTYNPVTDHLLIGARINSPTIKGIYIIDADTGAHVGELQGSAAITGGTIVLTRIGVADDGAIYGVNFGTLSDTNPLKIYRWASESASAPTIAYEGNPAAGFTGNQQWGKNMIVRGSGVNTQILLDTRTQYLALFTTSDGVNFFPNIIVSDAYDEANIGMDWGEGNTYWGKSPNEPLHQWEIDQSLFTTTLLRSYPDYPGGNFMNFDFSEDGNYLAGLVVQSGPDAVELYDFSDRDENPVLVDRGLFATDNPHTVNYGNVIISTNRVFALNPNNGVAAWRIGTPQDEPTLSIARSGNNVVISWPAAATGFTLQATENLGSGQWTTVQHETQAGQNQAVVPTTGDRRFFRLVRQQ